MSQLIPFKAYFEFSFSGNLSQLQDKEDSDIYLGRMSENGTATPTERYVKAYLTGFKISIFKKDFEILFDAHSVHSISPEEIRVESQYRPVEFKVNSFPVEVIQIVDKKVTFVDKNNTVSTFETNPKFRLVRI